MRRSASKVGARARWAANEFAFVIQTRDGATLACAANGAIAYAMFRAALSEHRGRGLVLKEAGEILAERY